MAKNNSKRPDGVAAPAGKPAAPAPRPAAATPVQKEKKGLGIYLHPLIAAAIGLITWLFLKVCTNNLLTNWDDPGYITGNQLIKDLSPDGIKAIFSTSVMGNYHPLTILTYAIEYSYVRLVPYMYHLDSLLIHIAVTMLVYWLVQLLSRRPVAAAIAALLFGLHPMHVESVAWLAGRKDVVYGAFYIAACIAYVCFLRAKGMRRYTLYTAVILLYLCSLLGKPVAVILPVTLFLIDYFEQRRLTYWVLIEKIPHFVIAIIFGLQSVKDQKKFGSLSSSDLAFGFFDRIALGAYALVTYLWKAVVPVGLCNFYPYPLKVGGSLPGTYYIYPVIALAVLAAAAWFGRKSRIVIFGSLFFLVNIVLLLQFLPVGGAIIADRYTYIPYLGLFFMAGWLVSGFFQPGGKKELGYTLGAVAGIYILVLGYLSNERCQVWYDTTSLWRDEIEKVPHDAPNAWNNLGFEYFNKYNESVNPAERRIYYDSSFYFLNVAISIQPTFALPYISLGELERSEGPAHFAEAKKNYYKALAVKTADEGPNAYLGLAIIYAISQKFDSSDFCFRQAITGKPYFPEAHSNYGNFYDMTGHYDSALVQYAISVAQNPDIYAPHLNRGRLLYRMKRYDEAMKDFNDALALSPNNGEVYYSRSMVYLAMGNKPQAIQDVQKAATLGFTAIDKNYLQALK